MVLLRPGEVAQRLQLTEKSVLGLIHSGNLSAVNIGKGHIPRYRVPQDSLDNFLASRVTTGGRERDR